MFNQTKTGIYKCKNCQSVKSLTIKWNKPLPKTCYCDNCRKQLAILIGDKK